MKRGLLVVFLTVAVAVTGCAHGHIVTAPDGQPATHVTCHHRHQSKCFAKAQRICPWGYRVLDEGYGSLLFRCGQYTDPPPPESDPDNPNMQPPPETSPPPPPAEKLYRT